MTTLTWRSMRRVLLSSVGAVLVLNLTLANPVAAAAPPALVTLLEDVAGADGKLYNASDDQSVGMDTAKVITNPQGGYLAVYHHLLGGAFAVRLATSSDLRLWYFVGTLANNASQPTIAALSDGGFLLAYEKGGCGSGSCLQFAHYATAADLYAGAARRTVAVNRTLSACNEGTPNIYAATLNPDLNQSIINVGFHYFSGCSVDREATGTLTNFASWRATADTNLNTLFTNLGTIGGNVGDRDAFFYTGRPYSIVEAQSRKNDFSSWRPYLFDRTGNSLTALTPHTDGASTAFGNPTYTDLVLPGGGRGMVSTQFIFSEGAAAGEAGQLIYYKRFPTQPAPDTTAPTVAITQPTNGARIRRGTAVTITATASDTGGVSKVAFYVNGVLTCVSPFGPYSCGWTVPNRSGVTYTLTARAFDTSTNSSTAAVTVTST